MPEKSRAGSILTVVACIALLAVAGLFAVMKVTGQATYDQKRAANEASIEELQKQLDSIKDPEVTVEEVEAQVYSAGDAGSRVADFQNLYRTSGTDSESTKTIAENMDRYLDDSSNIWRIPWYSERVSLQGVKWQFETTYSFTEKSIPVLWTCKDEDGRLLAYATADYVGETKKFTNVDVCKTSLGVSAALAENETTHANLPSPSPTPDIFAIAGVNPDGTPISSPSPDVSSDVSDNSDGEDSSSGSDSGEGSGSSSGSDEPVSSAPSSQSGSTAASLTE